MAWRPAPDRARVPAPLPAPFFPAYGRCRRERFSLHAAAGAFAAIRQTRAAVRAAGVEAARASAARRCRPAQGADRRAGGGVGRGPGCVPVRGPWLGEDDVAGAVGSRSSRPFAWVSVDQHDNDPIVLLTYIAAALDRVSPLDASVFDALASPGTSVEGTLIPRLGAALAALDKPVVLVLDDVHLLDSPSVPGCRRRTHAPRPRGLAAGALGTRASRVAAGNAARGGPCAGDWARRAEHGSGRGAPAVEGGRPGPGGC